MTLAIESEATNMAVERKLNKPWLVAVWPGMGHVAVSAGYYLMAKLGMHQIAEVPNKDLFDVEHVEVKGGLIRTGRLPRSRIFAWQDVRGRRDIVVFIGEAQPPRGKFAFCRGIIEFARGLGVERVFTFAAMGTQMHPESASRVFAAATDEAGLAELRQRELTVLEDGHIGGLNGVLLGAAAEAGLRGACLLGEIPHFFAQLPFPKASLAVLQVFTKVADLEMDFTELAEQAKNMEQKLGELLQQMQQAYEQENPPEAEAAAETLRQEPVEEEGLSSEDEARIERLFAQAAKDRSSAYELKRELDRLKVFPRYEDRFLDLFKKPE
jgi:proteasome assembly chaperone (PAC2) family protein